MQQLEASVKANTGQTMQLAKKVTEVEGQVQEQGQAIAKQIDDKFTSQLKDIEALLAKRARNE